MSSLFDISMYCHINIPANEYINSKTQYVESIPNFLIKLFLKYTAFYHTPRWKIQYYCKILQTWMSFMYMPYIITVKFGWQNPPRSFVLMTEQWKTSAKWYQKQCLSTFMAHFILVPFFVFTDDVISITKTYNITYRLSKSSTFS